MPDQLEIYRQLADSILQRYQTHTSKNLLDVYQGDDHFYQLDSQYLEFIFTNRSAVLNVLADPLLSARLLKVFVDEALRFTYDNNQFIQISPPEQQVFVLIYRRYLESIQHAVRQSETLEALEQNLAETVRAHFEDLKTNIARFFDPGTEHFVSENIILKKAVCSEYSPKFQLSILGLDPEQLKSPVLDLGCGRSGQLVKYLNRHGIQAVGIDRVVDVSDGLISADWLSWPLEADRWGTIVSHMAFSNHFIFHHRYKNGHPEAYARRYVDLLAALKPGGSFIYAPGLPFIETFLPTSTYTVLRRDIKPVEDDLAGLRAGMGPDTWYVSEILKY